MAGHTALRACKACGKNVSRYAKSCPNCGDQSTWHMFIVVIFLILILQTTGAAVLLLADISGYLNLIKTHMEEIYPPETTTTAREYDQRWEERFPWSWLK